MVNAYKRVNAMETFRPSMLNGSCPLVFGFTAVDVGNNRKARIVFIQFRGFQFFKRQSEIDGHDG